MLKDSDMVEAAARAMWNSGPDAGISWKRVPRAVKDEFIAMARACVNTLRSATAKEISGIKIDGGTEVGLLPCPGCKFARIGATANAMHGLVARMCSECGWTGPTGLDVSEADRFWNDRRPE